MCTYMQPHIIHKTGLTEVEYCRHCLAIINRRMKNDYDHILGECPLASFIWSLCKNYISIILGRQIAITLSDINLCSVKGKLYGEERCSVTKILAITKYFLHSLNFNNSFILTPAKEIDLNSPYNANLNLSLQKLKLSETRSYTMWDESWQQLLWSHFWSWMFSQIGMKITIQPDVTSAK